MQWSQEGRRIVKIYFWSNPRWRTETAITPPRLFDSNQIRLRVRSCNSRYTTTIQSQRVKGQAWRNASAVKLQLENVANVNALQLEAARRRAVPLRFNFVARAKFEVAQPIRCRLRAFSLLIRYVTVWPWTFDPVTLTFDLWPWTMLCDSLHKV